MFGRKKPSQFMIIQERDVGLFSLYHQVINSLSLAKKLNLIPIVFFGEHCCYHTARGYRGKKNVWEYYFQPLDTLFSESHILMMNEDEKLSFFDNNHVLNDYSPTIENSTADVSIPFLADPNKQVRKTIHKLIKRNIHIRDYIKAKVENFWHADLASCYVIGVHIRGTDAIDHELRKQVVILEEYFEIIDRSVATARKLTSKNIKLFIASDDEAYIHALKRRYPNLCVDYPAIRKSSSEKINSGVGPTGEIMPYFLTQDRELAAQSGEDVLVEHLLLSRCDFFIHNISSLARSVLMQNPTLEHINIRQQDYHKIQQILSRHSKEKDSE